MLNIKKIAAAAATFSLIAGMAACRDDYTREGGEITSVSFSSPETETVTESAEVEEFPLSSKILADRNGGVVQVPKNVNKIVSAEAYITDIIAALGAGGRVIAADRGSRDIEGIDSARCIIDSSASIVDNLNPDVIFVGNNLLGFSGNVVRIPRSSSMQAIKLDIEFLAGYTGTEERGSELISEIDMVLAYCTEKSMEIETSGIKKKVYFERQDASGQSCACGKGTFANELITLIGAENVCTESGETVPDYAKITAANPDVIIVVSEADSYNSDDIVNEIKSRPGWGNTGAVQISAVYALDGSFLLPTHRAAENLTSLGVMVYPEIYGADV